MVLHEQVRAVLLRLLAEQAVLGALAATVDGLIIDTLALSAEDAERLGAASALLARHALARGERSGVVALGTGALAFALGERILVAALLDATLAGQSIPSFLTSAADQLDAVLMSER
ncbi:hypothetical protein [Thermorudis peleae]|uniref:hypothetical protein n=1 Tax=Thermorudis peleae TaxID=1382356 RepID=UPI0005716E76|nr:hypothetical protein [Thermorudis peleae]